MFYGYAKIFTGRENSQQRRNAMTTKQRKYYKSDNIVKGSADNIEMAYLLASESSIEEGKDWYPNARMIADQIGSGNTRMGAGLLAVMSPQMDWDSNIIEAWRIVLEGWSPRQTKINNNKALAIKNGAEPTSILGGQKVTAFFHAIMQPTSNTNAVIDRHAIAVYYGKIPTKQELNKVFGSKRIMKRIQVAYKKASKNLGIPVHTLQATTWVQHRKNIGIAKEEIF